MFSVLSFWPMFAHQEVSSQLFLYAHHSTSSRTWGNGTDKRGQLVSCNSQFYSEHWTVYTTRIKRSHGSKVHIAKASQHSSGKLHMAAAWSSIEACKQTTVAPMCGELSEGTHSYVPQLRTIQEHLCILEEIEVTRLLSYFLGVSSQLLEFSSQDGVLNHIVTSSTQ